MRLISEHLANHPLMELAVIGHELGHDAMGHCSESFYEERKSMDLEKFKELREVEADFWAAGALRVLGRCVSSRFLDRIYR